MKRSRSPEAVEEPRKRQRTESSWWKTDPFSLTPVDLRLNEVLLDTGILPACLLPIIHAYCDWTTLTLQTTVTWAGGMGCTMASNGKTLFVAGGHHDTIVRYDIGAGALFFPGKCAVPNIEQLHFDSTGRLFCLANRQIFEICPNTGTVRDWWCSVDVKDRIVRHDTEHGLVLATFGKYEDAVWKWCASPRTECRVKTILHDADTKGMVCGRMAPSIVLPVLYSFDRFSSFIWRVSPEDASTWQTCELPEGHALGFLAPGRSFEFSPPTLRVTVLRRNRYFNFKMDIPGGTVLDMLVNEHQIFFLIETADSVRLEIHAFA